jgi:ABC-2 type transport system permease protein
VILLVARREITERLRQRSFQYSMAATVVIVIAIAWLAGLTGGDDTETYRVGAQGRESVVIAEAARAAGPGLDVKLTLERFDRAGDARAAVDDESVDAALVDVMVVSLEQPDDALVQALQTGARQVRIAQALEAEGVSEGQARSALDPPPLRVQALEGDEAKGASGVAFVASILLYGMLVVFGIAVAQGVVEEKASRVIEVLLSTIAPRQLLMGKILGVGVLGLLQLLVAAVAGLAVASARGVVEVDGAILEAVAVALVWFLFGYAFWASLYAVSGVIVSRQEDLTASSIPLTLVLVASYLVAIPAINEPDGTLAVVASIVPVSSPVVMPARVALGDATAAEMALSLGLLAVGAFILMSVGARVYEGAVLRMGKPLKLVEAFRAAR